MSRNHKYVSTATALFDLGTILARALHSEVPMQQLRAFFYVGMAGATGIDQRTLQKAIGLSSAGISRVVRALSQTTNDNKRRGLNVLTHAKNSADKRRRIIRVNAKGRRLLKKLERHLGQATAT